MDLKKLNKELDKLKKSVGDTFVLNPKDTESITKKSKLSKKIDKLEKKENESKKRTIEQKKNIDDRVKKHEETKRKHKKEVEESRKKLNQKIKKTNDNKLSKQATKDESAIDKLEDNSITTVTASNEIKLLLGAMIQRKELTNRIGGLDVYLKKSGRVSILVVEDINLFSLKIDGDGSMAIRVDNSRTGKKVFKFVIIPLLRALDDYLGGLGIRISNKKDPNKILAFNPDKQIYVSSSQITNKPVKAGQTIRFTNLKKGRFTVK